MKQPFSSNWSSSVQPRKQRKFRANSPLHIRQGILSAHLSKALREKHGTRSAPIRKGDEVLIMRGAFKKKRAKVTSVDLKKMRVALENVQRSKKDGTKVNVYFDPSTLQIQTLNMEDKKRVKSLEKSKNTKPKKADSKEKTAKKQEKK